MTELLPLAVGIGLASGVLFTELFGLASGGLIVPGYIALYLTRPVDVLATVAVAFVTFGVVRALSSVIIIFGRRRTALMILVGYMLGMMMRSWSGMDSAGFSVIGFIIPGLIAVWMDRQGVLETLSSLVIVSVIVRLILVLVVGTEMMR